MRLQVRIFFSFFCCIVFKKQIFDFIKSSVIVTFQLSGFVCSSELQSDVKSVCTWPLLKLKDQIRNDLKLLFDDKISLENIFSSSQKRSSSAAIRGWTFDTISYPFVTLGPLNCHSYRPFHGSGFSCFIHNFSFLIGLLVIKEWQIDFYQDEKDSVRVISGCVEVQKKVTEKGKAPGNFKTESALILKYWDYKRNRFSFL